MTKKQFYILFSSVLVMVLMFTNPSEENHIESVKSKLKIAFKKKMTSELMENDSDIIESMGNGLGLLIGDAFIEEMTEGFISRNNFLLFSTTFAEYEGKRKTIGFGILGNVFLSDKIGEIFNEQKGTDQKQNVITGAKKKSYLEIFKKYIGEGYIDEDGNLRIDDDEGNFLSIYDLNNVQIFEGDINNDDKSEAILHLANSGGGAGGNVEIIEDYLIAGNQVVSIINKELIDAPKTEFGYNVYISGIENDYVVIDFILRNENDGFYASGKIRNLKCKLIGNRLKVEY
ncbi:hypothetical protein [Sinomicrobium oceani]|uniref:hypothetical protein n=1 Tax=Sinomicrobium oceani TaxID=1150368 RepID=UPI00227A29A1|nr:hypothetical protein [Sinomicrobium oceani]